MNYLLDALGWIADPAHLSGPDGVPTRMAEHLLYTLVAVALASLVAIPAGYLIGHTGKGRTVAVALTGGVRALPTVGVVFLLALLMGIGSTPPVIAFVVLAIPSVLAGAYSGFEAVDRATIDAARAMGMTERQIVAKVEVPLGLPLLIGGIRAAVLQVVATATLAAYVGAGGLGGYVFLGLKTQDYAMMLGASILVIALAIAFEIVFSVLQRAVVPAGVAERSTRRHPGSRERTRTPLPEGTPS